MATPKRRADGTFKPGGGGKKRKRRAKRGTAKRRAKRGTTKRRAKRGTAKRRAKRGTAKRRTAKTVRGVARRERSLETRVRRLEGDMEVVHGATTAVVNLFRKEAGAAPLKRLPGYVSPLGRQTATKLRALPAGKR